MNNANSAAALTAILSNYGIRLVTGDHKALEIEGETVILFSKTVRQQGFPTRKIWDFVINNGEAFTDSPDSRTGYKTFDLAIAAAENILN